MVTKDYLSQIVFNIKDVIYFGCKHEFQSKKKKKKKFLIWTHFPFCMKFKWLFFKHGLLLKNKLLGFQCVENHSLSWIVWQWKFLNIAK
jgi:hypothetical protein